eukprot:jgi/Tetstr1/427884/TSEL_017960.t1
MSHQARPFGGGRGGRGRQSRGDRSGGGDPQLQQLSRKLTKLLRHRATERGLAVRPDGYVALSEVLALPEFRGVLSVEQVREIVAADNKQRFSLLEEGAGEAALWIRANQGHSLQGLDEGALLVRLEREEQMPACVVHGTYRAHWPAIREQGLRRMQRTHVHMAKGLPGEGGVLSGVRASSELLIYVDVRGAMAAGIDFFESANGVIMCGEVPPRFFSAVIDRDSGADLLLAG